MAVSVEILRILLPSNQNVIHFELASHKAIGFVTSHVSLHPHVTVSLPRR